MINKVYDFDRLPCLRLSAFEMSAPQHPGRLEHVYAYPQS
jgi:hypothetical protein